MSFNTVHNQYTVNILQLKNHNYAHIKIKFKIAKIVNKTITYVYLSYQQPLSYITYLKYSLVE